MKNIYIYRNMIFRNGYLQVDELGTGRNAIRIEEEGGEEWHGSYENIWIANNTVADNAGYGLKVSLRDVETMASAGQYENLDADTYYMSDVYVINNVFYKNTGPSDQGGQVGLIDKLKDGYRDERGFLCSISLYSNAYSYRMGEGGEVVWIQTTGTVAAHSPWALARVDDLLNNTCLERRLERRLVMGEHSMTFSGSLTVFRDAGNSDYRLSSSSPLIDAGMDIRQARHYEEEVWLTRGPDYNYSIDNGLFLLPSIGADE